MECKTQYSLYSLNTFGVDAVAAGYVRFESEDEIVDFLHENSLSEQRYLILGKGSNLLFANDFDGTILHPVLKGIDVLEDDGRHVRIKAMAGETWDDLVGFSVANGWGGIENLSLIPGSVGASAVQNIGAYGVEVGAVIDCVEAISMADGEKNRFAPEDCGFGYRHSHFKGRWAGQFMITAVIFRLDRQPYFVLDYPGVKSALEQIGPATLVNLRQAIISIRQRKLPDPATVGNAGSFFKNPVVDETVLSDLLNRFPNIPHYPHGDDQYKLAAGWMVERSGWKGKSVGRAAVHDKQALVLVNLGDATGREILALSEQVQRAVHDRFGLVLEREVLVIE